MRWRAAIIVMLGCACVGTAACAQTSGDGPEAPAHEADEAWLDLATLDDASWTSLAHAYREAPHIEHWDITAVASSDDSPSRLVVRLSAGDVATGNPPAARIELGSSLILSATGDRLRAAHAKNPTMYYEVALPGGVSSGAIFDAIPPVPLPQLCLAFDRNPSTLHARFAMMRARVDPANSRLRELVWTSRAGIAMRATLVATLADQPDAPQGWMITADDRQRVEALTDLTPLASVVHIGDRVPAMGLFDDAWAGWAWDTALQEIADKPPQPAGRACALLVLSRMGDARTPADAATLRTAWKAATNVERDLEILRLSGKLAKPRAMATLVGVVEVADVGPATVKSTREQLAEAGIDTSRLRWTSIGKEAMHRIVPEARSAIIVLDADQVLRGVVRIDDRMADVATLERELRAVLDEANESL